MKKNFIIIGVLVVLGLGLYIYRSLPQETIPEQNIEPDEVVQEQEMKIYQGEGFTFEYPGYYDLGPSSLWEPGRYQYFIKPRVGSSTDHIPDVLINSKLFSETVEVYLRRLHAVGDDYLIEDIADEYSLVQLGDYEFTKFKISELHQITNYVTIKDDLLINFQVHNEDDDNQVLLDMISTLVIE